MEKQVIKTEEPLKIDGYSIQPILRHYVLCKRMDKGITGMASKKPLAVLITKGVQKYCIIFEEGISKNKLVDWLPQLKNQVVNFKTSSFIGRGKQ
jgi:hypothetical protein